MSGAFWRRGFRCGWSLSKVAGKGVRVKEEERKSEKREKEKGSIIIGYGYRADGLGR